MTEQCEVYVNGRKVGEAGRFEMERTFETTRTHRHILTGAETVSFSLDVQLKPTIEMGSIEEIAVVGPTGEHGRRKYTLTDPVALEVHGNRTEGVCRGIEVTKVEPSNVGDETEDKLLTHPVEKVDDYATIEIGDDE